MSGKVVIDASLALKWVLTEPFSDEALALLEEWRMQEVRLCAPELLIYEAASALYKRTTRGELPLDQAQKALDELIDTGPRLVTGAPLSSRAMEIAQDFKRPTAYDAQYLALAERENCACWTADERLWNAVRHRIRWVRWIGERPPGKSTT